jgi:hypothetical protein
LTPAAFEAILGLEKPDPVPAQDRWARQQPMIAIEADFNHLDGEGRRLLADLVVHERTPFAEIAQFSERIVFVDSGEFVEGRIVEDKERG